jgi:serine/threonine-protein kinase
METFKATPGIDEKIDLCGKFLKEHPGHPRAAEVRKLGEAPDATRGWFKELLPPRIARGAEKPLYVYDTQKGLEIEMVYVPPGDFLMGSDLNDREKPKHKHPVPQGFYIARTEATCAEYRVFCKQMNRPEPEGAKGAADTLPVVNVSWAEANAFCAWAGLALPSEVEWEKAARGPDGRRFPWGEGAPSEKLAVFGQDRALPQPVGSCPDGAAPTGALDMSGNVWQWCANWQDAGAYARWAQGDLAFAAAGSSKVVRGGSCLSGPPALRASWRNWFSPKCRFPDLGFRCIYKVKS